MKKILHVSLFALLLSSLANASVVSLATVKSVRENGLQVLPITINNQANRAITSDSNFIPSDAKFIAPQGAVSFDLKIPDEIGTQRIRFFNGTAGCDFYIDTRNTPVGVGSHITYITGVGIDQSSSCNVIAVQDVNHLAVSFMQMGPVSG